MSSRYLALCSVLAAGVIAGCGSSSNADTAHIQAPPSASQTLTYSATATSTSTSTTTTPAVTTPTSGPLATEPTIKVPPGAAPKTLKLIDIVKGTGATAAAGDTITANYVGALYSNGKVFDASWNRKQVFTTLLADSAVIPGMVQGVAGMKVGGRRELIIPPALAYKAAGSPPSIPGNATIIFIVDLLGVTPATGATGATG